MKTELKQELFYSAKDLCNFVNEHQQRKIYSLLLRIQRSMIYFIGR